MPQYDAIVIGSGPNGLAAAIALARAGWSVCLYEAKDTVGGGMRNRELTLPGYLHDVCSAVHPLGIASPFFQSLPLQDYGLEWIHPTIPLAHPFDDGSAAVLHQSLDLTCEGLGVDGGAYRRLMQPLVENWEQIADFILGPLRLPKNPIIATRFGYRAAWPITWLAKIFSEAYAPAMLAGLAAHSFLPLDKITTSAFGLVLGILGHMVGWPIPKGGSQQIANALAAYFQSLGGDIVLNTAVQSVDELPKARAYLFDVTPKQLLSIMGKHLPDGWYKRRLQKYRYGPGVFKVDWALSNPIPWKSASCKNAGTIHAGGTLPEIAASEQAIWNGEHSDRPYVLVAQQSLFDDTRAPAGKHTAWAYCHVPHGSTLDMTEQIESQIERFAPGFRDCIRSKHTMNTQDYQNYNMNYIGGDINGGVQDIWQLFTRPTIRLRPYTTPAAGIYLCSASTPPGGGVHGLCGYHAARAVLQDFSK